MHKSKNRSVFSVFIGSIRQKTITVMNLFLMPLSAAFVYIGYKYCALARVNVIMATDSFYSSFEHLMISLTIVICGSALLDLSLREAGEMD